VTDQPLTDEMVEAKWAEIAPLIDVMITRIQTPGEFSVQPDSELAADDIASSPPKPLPMQVNTCSLSSARPGRLRAALAARPELVGVTARELAVADAKVLSYSTTAIRRRAPSKFLSGACCRSNRRPGTWPSPLGERHRP
jgi:hypothetical protein